MDNLAKPYSDSDLGIGLQSLVTENGSASLTAQLRRFIESSRDPNGLRQRTNILRPALIADIAHFMCVSHGRHPGVIEHAATKILDDEAREWFVTAIDGFIIERDYLNRLTVAAGPIRSHAGQDKVSALLAGQAKNFQMLATSDRNGTAAGAAIAFVLDWIASRPLLDSVATSLDIPVPIIALPVADESINFANAIAKSDNIVRAIGFGADQLLGQQRGLWQIIAARHAALEHSN
jgi:hypothetical protein